MNTPREVVEALRDARTSMAHLQGDALDAVIADLDALRAYEAAAARLGSDRDDSTPRNDEADAAHGCPCDETLHDTEGPDA